MTAWYSPSDAFDVRFPSRHGGCVFKLHVQLNVFPPEEITEMRDLCQLDKNYPTYKRHPNDTNLKIRSSTIDRCPRSIKI